MDLSKHLQVFLLAGCLAAFTGCQTTVTSTSRWYHPVAGQTYPPKAADAPITLLDNAPNQKYKVIGHFKMQKGFTDDIAGGSFEDGHDYMISAVKYNARLAGADAVVMLEDSERCESESSGPPDLGPGKSGGMSKNGNSSASSQPANDQASASVPMGATVTRTVDAQMIVFER